METVKGSKIRYEQKQQPPGTTAVTGGMTFSYCLVKLKIGRLKRYPQIFREVRLADIVCVINILIPLLCFNVVTTISLRLAVLNKDTTRISRKPLLFSRWHPSGLFLQSNENGESLLSLLCDWVFNVLVIEGSRTCLVDKRSYALSLSLLEIFIRSS